MEIEDVMMRNQDLSYENQQLRNASASRKISSTSAVEHFKAVLETHSKDRHGTGLCMACKSSEEPCLPHRLAEQAIYELDSLTTELAELKEEKADSLLRWNQLQESEALLTASRAECEGLREALELVPARIRQLSTFPPSDSNTNATIIKLADVMQIFVDQVLAQPKGDEDGK